MKNNKNKMKKSKNEVIFDAVNYIFLGLAVILVMYPLIYVVSASVSSPSAVGSGEMWLFPVGFTLDGYSRIFEDSRIWTGYGNTILYTLVGTILNVVVTVFAAYPLSCREFIGRSFFTKMVIFTMYFSGGLIPLYMLVSGLKLVDSMWAIILPGLVAVYNMIIVKSYFENSLPGEIREAAMMDGCSQYMYLWKIVVPLSKSVLAVVTLYYAVAHWNEYFNSLIYLNTEEKYPLQMVLRSILVENEMSAAMMEDITTAAKQQEYAELIKYGVVVVASVPVLCMYPFVQKFFVKGSMIGAVKG